MRRTAQQIRGRDPLRCLRRVPFSFAHRHRRKCSTRNRPCRSSQAPRRAPAERRFKPGERRIDAPLTVMDRLVLHELPCEEGKRERRSGPNDWCADVDSFECGEQVSLLVVKRGEERLPSQRADIVLVFACPIHSFRRQRGVVDATHTDDVPQLLAKRRETVANPMRCWCAARPSGRVGRKVPFVCRDRAHKIDGQAVEHVAVPCKFIDRHLVILAAGFTTGC